MYNSIHNSFLTFSSRNPITKDLRILSWKSSRLEIFNQRPWPVQSVQQKLILLQKTFDSTSLFIPVVLQHCGRWRASHFQVWNSKSKICINFSRFTFQSLELHGEDPNSRGVSPSRSDSSGGGGYTSSDTRSTSPNNRPISYHEGITVATRPVRPLHNKKRPAPPPPPAPSTSQENSIPFKDIPSTVEEVSFLFNILTSFSYIK